jgi:hypothetical protein
LVVIVIIIIIIIGKGREGHLGWQQWVSWNCCHKKCSDVVSALAVFSPSNVMTLLFDLIADIVATSRGSKKYGVVVAVVVIGA